MVFDICSCNVLVMTSVVVISFCCHRYTYFQMDNKRELPHIIYSGLVFEHPLNKVNRGCYEDRESWVNILFLFEPTAKPGAKVQWETSSYHFPSAYHRFSLHYTLHNLKFEIRTPVLKCVLLGIYWDVQNKGQWEKSWKLVFAAKGCKQLKKEISLSNRAHRESS